MSRTAALFPRAHIAWWFIAGTCWLAQILVPWTSAGPLSHASMVDGVRLVLRGPLGEAVPGWSVAAAMVLPASGLVLVAVAGSQRPGVRLLRLAIASVGTVTFAAILWALTGLDPARLGPGGLVALLGTVMVVSLVAISFAPLRPRES